ncbi:MAG: NADH-quinone oxidoreductase subunit L [Candidatus Methanomethylicia archaeon]|nr:NADH-quinone oxidoreductase subunit L [Candidatus Methanomethylicia archaeon]MCX8168847.1 NADH-quinone oxidoreductase subunit L [Candidatus Methanomethylicia archaeon]MDW7988579.1 NADH-quinone oxidoreductase subunit L [Nitrososphaerota archaeon]
MLIYSPWLVWIIPIVGALLTPLIARFSERIRDLFAVFVSFIAALMATINFNYVVSGGMEIPGLGYVKVPIDWRLRWFIIPGYPLEIGVLLDPLSAFMGLIVAWISFLIMVYSLGYMHGEEGLTRYWFFMNFFIGNMLLLVMSDNILQMLFGWEGVGLCSYQLIGFYYSDEKKKWIGNIPPSHAGMKAFITTKIGDLFLMISAFIIFIVSGTFNFIDLQTHYEWIIDLARLGLIIPVTVLFFLGPVGKSAQFPLHEWLPEAMAGPTSVSALIHAATMVKAGVYLVARIFPVFNDAFVLATEHVHGLAIEKLILQARSNFFLTVAWIGAFTAFLAATQAMVNRELKKVLAYSTVSQIGYMMLGLGAGGLAKDVAIGYVAGVFHLASHAIFKALLFMAAGAVIHVCESTDMFNMGGIRKDMPITFICMLIGALSLSGIPPLSGFWSKEVIFTACIISGQYVLLALAAITAAITFFYSLRMIGITFLGDKSEHLKELEHEGHHVHEVSKVMWVPYMILASSTIALGLIGPLFEKYLHYFLEPSIHMIHYKKHLSNVVYGAEATVYGIPIQLITLSITFCMLVIGGLPAYLMYISRKVDPESFVEVHGLKGLYNFLWNRWYINTLYYKVFVYSLINGSVKVFKGFEKAVIDRFNYASANFVISFSNVVFKYFEKPVLDGLNYLIAKGFIFFSQVFRRIQTGISSFNILGISIGIIILILLLFIL